MLSVAERWRGLAPPLAKQAEAVSKALAAGRVDEAERGAIALLAQAPEHPEALRLSGAVQVARRRFGEAIATLRAAAARRPDDPLIHHALANAYEATRDDAAALDSMRRACVAGPDIADCWFNLGRFLSTSGRAEEAEQALARAVLLAPRAVEARALLASTLNLEGRADEAAAQYREILARNPSAGQAWWGLATLKPMPLDGADIGRMRAALGTQAIGPSDRIATGFALAHALEHAGEYVQAFDALREANALARRNEPWDAAQFEARIRDILDVFGDATCDTDDARGHEAIFVVSLPRSGSTLVEQILASHSAVEGTLELADLPQVIVEESRRERSHFPLWARGCAAERWRALGERYLERTARWRERRPRFTDKMPGNWLYVGAIMRMLPQARVVVVRREPLETCFGCYRYLFNGHGYTHDFADLATAWRGFDRVCTHWATLYPDRVREQSYEALTADPETQIRELLAFCGLPFEHGCLEFHKAERRIATPSAGQVRQPMRRDTARTGKYGALLDPLRTALGLPRWS